MNEAIAKQNVARLNAMPTAELAELLRACCGSARWVEGMIARRPWMTPAAVLAASDDVCRKLGTEDWLEAFAHHPRLGESRAAVAQDERARDWSAREQGSLTTAASDVKVALAAANEAYEATFGFICIICAEGRDPEELLAITKARLSNAPNIELRIASEEQRKITRLRLLKLFNDLGTKGPS